MDGGTELQNLSKYRRAAGLNQYELGGLAKVGRSKIANVETGRATFTAAERARIVKVLSIRIEQNVKDLNKDLDSTEHLNDQKEAGEGMGARSLCGDESPDAPGNGQ